MAADPLIAGVELGGTKAIAVIAAGDRIVRQVTLPTTNPDETLGRLREQLDDWKKSEGFAALGIASFGPLQLHPSASDFGAILTTPKPGWTGAAVAKTLTNDLGCPAQIDTDVNGSALAEHRWGAGRGLEALWYLTIGTGVGGGFLVNGEPIHGAMHPEIGHILIRRRKDDPFSGCCPFHGDCIEGLVAGPALMQRFGRDPTTVPDTDPIWVDVAGDLAELLTTILMTASPQRILIGGGIGAGRQCLLPMIRRIVLDRAGGYLPFLNAGTVADIIQPPALGVRAGPLGAVALGLRALVSEQRGNA